MTTNDDTTDAVEDAPASPAIVEVPLTDAQEFRKLGLAIGHIEPLSLRSMRWLREWLDQKIQHREG